MAHTKHKILLSNAECTTCRLDRKLAAGQGDLRIFITVCLRSFKCLFIRRSVSVILLKENKLFCISIQSELESASLNKQHRKSSGSFVMFGLGFVSNPPGVS